MISQVIYTDRYMITSKMFGYAKFNTLPILYGWKMFEILPIIRVSFWKDIWSLMKKKNFTSFYTKSGQWQATIIFRQIKFRFTFHFYWFRSIFTSNKCLVCIKMIRIWQIIFNKCCFQYLYWKTLFYFDIYCNIYENQDNKFSIRIQ